MNIKELHLENFRGVRSMTLPLSPRMNVLAGENGAGKSTILDAAAILLSWPVARIRHAGSSGRPIQDLDIHNKTYHAKLSCLAESSGDLIHWSMAKIRKGGYAEQGGKSDYASVNEYAKTIQRAITERGGAGRSSAVRLLSGQPGRFGHSFENQTQTRLRSLERP